LGARERDPGALGARMEPLAGEHHAGLDQLLVEVGHLAEDLLARHLAGFALGACLDQNHHSHVFLLRLEFRLSINNVERGRPKSTRARTTRWLPASRRATIRAG